MKNAINNDVVGTELGENVILPSLLWEAYDTCMKEHEMQWKLCRLYGQTDLFMTFTCNPKSKEI